MTHLINHIAALDWTAIGEQLDAQGHAQLRGLVPAALVAEVATLQQRPECLQLGFDTDEPAPMQRQLLPEPLPMPLQQFRAAMYQRLQPIAQRWSGLSASGLSADPENASDQQAEIQKDCHRPACSSLDYPSLWDEFHAANLRAGQRHALSCLHRIQAGAHQDLQHQGSEPLTFPLAMTTLLNRPGEDFRGGELIFIEQRPRMQSRVMVVQPQLGDLVIFSTGQRPLRGAGGYTRAHLKRGISRVHAGVRIGVELFFHHSQRPTA